jgi:hypothetical protein
MIRCRSCQPFFQSSLSFKSNVDVENRTAFFGGTISVVLSLGEGVGDAIIEELAEEVREPGNKRDIREKREPLDRGIDRLDEVTVIDEAGGSSDGTEELVFPVFFIAEREGGGGSGIETRVR